jgi:3-hydroxy-3-methylglutaryl CoA synthase
MENKKYGIEKIRVYPTALQLDLEELAKERGYDVAHMHKELMVEKRGVNPPWEDSVTMAVNAAKPMLTKEDIASIGLLIVASETGLDHEKALSSWVFHHLGLPSNCRHFEVKIACYSGTAALKMGISWLASGMAKNGLHITPPGACKPCPHTAHIMNGDSTWPYRPAGR